MFQSIFAEFHDEFMAFHGPDMTTLSIRLLGTIVLCGIIGFEREVHKNTAGLRTNIMVGACLCRVCADYVDHA